jgi:hypothetical protein
MNNLQKRLLLFLVACIGSRTLLVYLAKTADVMYLPLMGYIALLPAFAFIYIYVTGSRPTGGEVFGEKIWWNKLRPVHGLLYGLFAYNAINKNRDSWKILLADVILGLSCFIAYHFSRGDFSKALRETK